MNTTCPKCNQACTLGVNATIAGCDSCTGVQRDQHGRAWHPDETHQVYQINGGQPDEKYIWTKRPNRLQGANQ